ncbi:hypothetical protein GCM10010421_23140 [Streptomyces glaucus]|uniref:Secreted protein n=1 Tax=Streptomyces glaucus TaxID=284029 RepID=A0ABN3JLV3_9ACTN
MPDERAVGISYPFTDLGSFHEVSAAWAVPGTGRPSPVTSSVAPAATPVNPPSRARREKPVFMRSLQKGF